MISPDRMERYRDFVDPERTGQPYDPRKGLERLLGVLTPDPKGIVLAAMGSDWYGNKGQLQSSIFSWLEELDLPRNSWPLTHSSAWYYCERVDQHGEIVDGSVVNLGAVVKKAEDTSQVLYSRSMAGAELAIPLVQQSVRFVSKAKESIPHKFDSMWRIIGGVQSSTDRRRPLALWYTVDFLIYNPGKHREMDCHNATQISTHRLSSILASLGNCGIIDYISPEKEVEGHRGRGWSVYTLAEQSIIDLDHNKLYQDIRGIRRSFYNHALLIKVLDYIKEHPDNEYEYRVLVSKFGADPPLIGTILSSLSDLSILKRSGPGFKGANEIHSSASANDLTHLFYDLVCAPAKDIADTLSPLPLRPWDRQQVAIYLQNYNEERSQGGYKEGKK